MKEFFVVVLVLLCGCCVASFKGPNGLPFGNRATRDGQVLTLKPLPCAFGLKYEQIDRAGLIEKGEYKQYNFSQMDTFTNEYGQISTSLKRADYSPSGTGDALFLATFTSTDGQCDVSLVSPCSLTTRISNAADVVAFRSLICDETKETTWMGEKCTNCTSSQTGTQQSFFVKDDLIIGYESSVTFKITEYMFDDFHKDMKLQNDCQSSSVPEFVYSPLAESKKCGTEPLTIKLKELPCSFGVKDKITSQGRTTEEEFKKYGNSQLLINTGDDGALIILMRADINFPGSPESVLNVFSRSEGDSCSVLFKSFVLPNPLPGVASFLYDFYPQIYCLDLKDTTWKGKKCKSCLMNADDSFRTVFVKDGLIIGFDKNDGEEIHELEYEFKDFRKDLALNENCTDDSDPLPDDVYSFPPEIEGCESKLEDTASSVSVLALMIICAVTTSLISLL